MKYIDMKPLGRGETVTLLKDSTVDRGLQNLKQYKKMNKMSIDWLKCAYLYFPDTQICIWIKNRTVKQLIKILKVNPELWEILI